MSGLDGVGGEGRYIIPTALVVQGGFPQVLVGGKQSQQQLPRPRPQAMLIGDPWRVSTSPLSLPRHGGKTCERETGKAMDVDNLLLIIRIDNAPEMGQSVVATVSLAGPAGDAYRSL